jgi:hypothetical protein
MHSSVLVALCFGVAAAQEGNLIVRKSVQAEVEGVFATESNFTVNIDVYNIGDASAFDVSVTDVWPETTSSGTDAFKIVDGSSTATWETLGAGEHVQHTFTVVPMFEGRFDGSRATGQYQATPESESKVVISTSMAPMTVLSQEQYIKYFAKHYQEWAIFGVLSSSTVLLPLLAYFSIQQSYSQGVPKEKSM